MNTLDFAIIAVSVILVVSVGLFASKRQKDKSARGYFLASGKLPWWIIGSAFVSTSVSSEQIVGTVGKACERGMGVANWEWWSLPVYLPLILIMLPVFLRNRVTTMPELLGRRFGSLCSDLYGWIMLVAYVFIFLVPVLYGGSLTFSAMTGLNFFVVLWAIVLFVALYTVKGGMISVMWTDALQCIMLLGGGILLFFVSLWKVPGGWNAMVAASPDRFHLYYPANDPVAPFLGMVVASVGLFLFYSAGNQVMIQRILAARSTWDGMIGVIFAGVINLFRPLVTCFLGLIVYHWIYVLHFGDPLAKCDDTFPFALSTLGSTWGLRGIVLMGFLAAVMSATSAQANSIATIFSLDLYRKFINPGADDRRTVMVGRIASFTALAGAACMAPAVEHLGGIFTYFQTSVTYLATPFISVILMGILWRRANYASAVFGLIGGFVITLAVAFGLPPLLNAIYPDGPTGWIAGYVFVESGKICVHWLYLGFIAQVIIMASMVVVALLTAPPDYEKTDAFVWRPRMVSQYDEGVKRPWYKSLWLWLGAYASVWFFLYWKFW
jgi:SSS family solute:Na+ symporter